MNEQPAEPTRRAKTDAMNESNAAKPASAQKNPSGKNSSGSSNSSGTSNSNGEESESSRDGEESESSAEEAAPATANDDTKRVTVSMLGQGGILVQRAMTKHETSEGRPNPCTSLCRRLYGY